MSDEGITAVAAIISALAAAGSAAYSIQQSGQKKDPFTMATGKPSPADMATAGLVKNENMGAASPGWKSGITGGATGPLPGAGSATATPVVPGEVSKSFDEAAGIFSKLG